MGADRVAPSPAAPAAALLYRLPPTCAQLAWPARAAWRVRCTVLRRLLALRLRAAGCGIYWRRFVLVSFTSLQFQVASGELGGGGVGGGHLAPLLPFRWCG
jgi:hypothetical protein